MTMLAPKTIVISGLTGKMPLSPNQIYLPPNLSKMEDMDETDGNAIRKRKRLTHLSQDERMLRRKLKNRVAAQTARDRKKARMDELEEAMVRLEDENKKLQRENFHLKSRTEILLEENEQIKLHLTNNNEQSTEIMEEEDSVKVDRALGRNGPSESAVLATPQQQDRARAILHLTTHCLAFLMMISVTNSSGCLKKLQTSHPHLLPQLHHKLKRLQNHSHLLPPRLKKHLTDKWWGPQQRSWSPSKN